MRLLPNLNKFYFLFALSRSLALSLASFYFTSENVAFQIISIHCLLTSKQRLLTNAPFFFTKFNFKSFIKRNSRSCSPKTFCIIYFDYQNNELFFFSGFASFSGLFFFSGWFMLTYQTNVFSFMLYFSLTHPNEFRSFLLITLKLIKAFRKNKHLRSIKLCIATK